jgi:S-adenosyl-L-methionine hydrolase (adenosine-forming)
LSERRYARPTVSRTFEGRDRFAPAAAWLARGIQLPALGRPAGDFVRLDIPQASVEEEVFHGTILRVDRFGNLVTNLERRDVEKFAQGHAVAIEAGGHPVPRLVATYADMPAGEVCALYGSTDHLEFAENGASAATRLGLGRGAPVRVMRT